MSSTGKETCHKRYLKTFEEFVIFLFAGIGIGGLLAVSYWPFIWWVMN
jgi:hypothetical protein